ncbi:transglutaminase family protein [Sandaracinus amylolyticus]|uniref:transglutaminase family protein n=1 Tax=Sandaracinus amylolyticus TaxID=927083 RepID=UPI001F42E7AF|nr:transglutaminase family protein [Sandaracinus amylolyticus]UJR79993.1 Transglutaminase [Sandaracinus amylolyticus]
MRRFRIEHRTVYRYARAVSFGPHRLLLRPKEGPDLRVLRASIQAIPGASLRWGEDALGNIVAHATFAQRARTLVIESTLEVEHAGEESPAQLACASVKLPVSYSAIEAPDLQRAMTRHSPDPQGCVDAWARRFVRTSGDTPALELLEGMVRAVHDELRWEPRDEEGTQMPLETLARGVGACRDFALLVIEACRSLGLAARFVSGYLYDPSRDVEPAPRGGATHAWVQVYLPGAGWIELDPTHGRVGNAHLVRVAVARDPASLAPITGTWIGFPGDAIGMEVDVQVRAVRDVDESGARRLPGRGAEEVAPRRAG